MIRNITQFNAQNWDNNGGHGLILCTGQARFHKLHMGAIQEETYWINDSWLIHGKGYCNSFKLELTYE